MKQSQTYHISEYPYLLRTRYANHHILSYFHQDRQEWVKLQGHQVSELCLSMAKAFAHIGLKEGERVGIYAPNSVYALCAEIALFMMRAVSVPLYATSTPEQVSFIVDDAEVGLMLVGDQFQYNNAYEVQQRSKTLRRLVVLDSRVILQPEDVSTMYLEEFIRRGDSKANETLVGVRSSEALLSDMAIIIYTSGTSGKSKGVVLRHSNLTAQIYEHQQRFDFVGGREMVMSFLPHSHIFEKMWVYYCLSIGCCVAVLSDPKKIQEALLQVRPTMMCNVPRFWEKVYSGVQDKIAQSSPTLRRVMEHAISIGYSYRIEYKNQGKTPPVYLSLLYRLYQRTLFAKLKKVLGLQRGRFFPVAGAALSVEVNRFLQSVGIPICIGYGLSETTATVSCYPNRGFVLDSVGEVLPHLDIRIDPENGEILLKGPTITEGYYRNPEANAEAFTPDGYFRTGDTGRLEGCTLFFTERIKDLFKTANGKYIAPQMLEGLLSVDPIIEQVAVLGDGYKFVSALIYPNWERLMAEAEVRGLDITRSKEELAADHQIRRVLMVHVEQALSTVAQYEQVKRFRLLTEPFSMEGGELTSTLKLRRRVISERYASLIEEMYADPKDE